MNASQSSTNRPTLITAGPEDAGLRLDVFCASRLAALSRSQIQKLNKAGQILVDGTSRPDHYHLQPGETVRVTIPPRATDTRPRPQSLPVRVLYEDEHIIVVNKAAGMVVHPAHGNREGTLVNAILGRGTKLSELGAGERPGVVHRLDKDTSGVMVLAKTDAAYGGLTRQIKARELGKVYHAIIWGNLGTAHRTIDGPIARHPVHRQKMAVVRRGGREAATKVFVVDTLEGFDYIRVFTSTGRTHQIRVHLSSISHPILGDATYGGRRQRASGGSERERALLESLRKTMKRQALHASKLSFAHPATGGSLQFRAPIPEDMRQALETLHRVHALARR